MKPKSNSARFLLSSFIILHGAALHADNLTWDGGGGDASWLTGANWVGDPASPPAFGVDSVQTFNATSPLNTDNYLGAATTIGTLAFNADADTDVNIRFYSNGTGAGGSATDLTFDVTTDSAAINVNADATGNFTLGVGAASILLSDNLVVTHNGTGSLTINRPIAMAPTFNALKLTKEGTGTVILGAVNTYNGGTTINGGTIKAGIGSIFNTGNGTPVVINSSGTLDINGKGVFITAFSGSGTLDNTSASGNTVQIGLNNVGGTFSGLIKNTGGGALSLWKWGSGTTVLSGLNTHTGITWCVGGTLSVDSISNVAAPAPSALGQPDSTNGNIRFGSGSSSAGTLRYTGPTTSTDRPIELRGTTSGGALNAAGTGPITFTGNVIAYGAGSKTFTLTGTSTFDNIFAGEIADNSEVNKTSLLKNGVGTWLVTANNPYTGTTTVGAGILWVNGNHLVGDVYSVLAPGTLGGTGTISASVAVTGEIAPGMSLGTLSTGPLVLNNGGALAMEINTSTVAADQIIVTGDVTRPGAAANLTVTDLGANVVLPLGTKFTLVDYSGTWDPANILDFNGSPVPNNSTIVVGANTFAVKYDDATAMTLTTVESTATPFETWINGFAAQIPNAADREADKDPDGDGINNFAEFALKGDPASGSNNGLVAVLTQDTDVPADTKELTLIAAVLRGALFAPNANNAQQASADGVVYIVEGSLALESWSSPVSALAAGTNTAPVASGLTEDLTGTDWEYRTFVLDASEGLSNKGFLRVKISE